jgi:hypothetical protein
MATGKLPKRNQDIPRMPGWNKHTTDSTNIELVLDVISSFGVKDESIKVMILGGSEFFVVLYHLPVDLGR